jgi:hypothetical protein
MPRQARDRRRQHIGRPSVSGNPCPSSIDRHSFARADMPVKMIDPRQVFASRIGSCTAVAGAGGAPGPTRPLCQG